MRPGLGGHSTCLSGAYQPGKKQTLDQTILTRQTDTGKAFETLSKTPSPNQNLRRVRDAAARGVALSSGLAPRNEGSLGW